MPDDQISFGHNGTPETLKDFIPPVLMAFGAVSLLRTSRLLSLVALGALLYDAAVSSDTGRKARTGQRNIEKLLDSEI
jgi:hypothetical protein